MTALLVGVVAWLLGYLVGRAFKVAGEADDIRDRRMRSFANGVAFGVDMAARPMIDATSHLTRDDMDAHFQILALSDAEAIDRLIAAARVRQ